VGCIFPELALRTVVFVFCLKLNSLMEFSLLFLVVAIVIFSIVMGLKKEIKYLVNIISILTHEVRSLKDEIITLQQDTPRQETSLEEKRQPENATYPQFQRKPEPVISEQPPVPPEPIPEIIEEPALPVIEAVNEIAEPKQIVYNEEVLSLHEPVASFTQPSYEKETRPNNKIPDSWFDKWLKNNPDLEKFIGENLINKIGIGVLVLGIAFFVKYAIDQDWINETGRVCIGIGCGAILVGLAHYLRNSYRSFSSVLAGGGIAVFYFTIAFAFHQYHLMSQTAAFIIMVVITAFAVALSVLYNKLELAIIASIGGFIAPFLVSTGDGNYIVLFTYLVILNIGLLSLAWFKRWPALNIIALFFTVVIYGSWLGLTISDRKPISYPIALLFASIFYLLFLGMNMINQVKNRQQFKPLDFIILLVIVVPIMPRAWYCFTRETMVLTRDCSLCVSVLSTCCLLTMYTKMARQIKTCYSC